MNTLVQTSIDDWKKTKWLKIDVEQMELDCRKFAKDIRALDKEASYIIITWIIYILSDQFSFLFTLKYWEVNRIAVLFTIL